jgi:N4-gp56 family major capsid protein
MATATNFALNDPLAVRRWSQSLSLEAIKDMYFSKFIGESLDSMLVLKTDLAKGAGESITVGLRMKLTKPGVEGDADIDAGIDGREGMTFFDDRIGIDTLSMGTSSAGKMSEQRVPYNIRKQGMDALRIWWSEMFDELIMYSLAGARGVTTSGMLQPVTFTGRAENPLTAPDAAHLAYGGDATGKIDIDTSDKPSLMSIEKLRTKAGLVAPTLTPFKVGGSNKYVYLVHPIQAYLMRTSTTENDWLKVHLATDSGLGKQAMMYSGAMGEYADAIIHESRNVVQFNDYGAAANLPAARALFLGAQSGLVAYGREGGPSNIKWYEELKNGGKQLFISTYAIFGTKQSRFNSKTFGLIAEDSYCPLTV